MYARYYRILNLSPGTGLEEVKRAYRKLAKIYHPDLNLPSSDREKFIEVTKAYERLTEYIKRPKYAKYVYTKKTYKAKAKRKQRRKRDPKYRAKRYSKMNYSSFKKENDAFTDPKDYWKLKLVFYGFKVFLYSVFSLISLLILLISFQTSFLNPVFWILGTTVIYLWYKISLFFKGWKKDYKHAFSDQ